MRPSAALRILPAVLFAALLACEASSHKATSGLDDSPITGDNQPPPADGGDGGVDGGDGGLDDGGAGDGGCGTGFAGSAVENCFSTTAQPHSATLLVAGCDDARIYLDNVQTCVGSVRGARNAFTGSCGATLRDCRSSNLPGTVSCGTGLADGGFQVACQITVCASGSCP